MIDGKLVQQILSGYPLSPMGIHGLPHWARVFEIGQRLAPLTGADAQVVALFSVFHDARRLNEGTDPDHGLRGAKLAVEMRTLLHVDDGQFQLLSLACRLHTAGLTDGHVTVRTCWDSDRLDLWRVGIKPRTSLLCTESARDQLLQEWSRIRSQEHHVPSFVESAWLS